MKNRVLVVDDEPTILLTLSAILQMNGYDVVTAASAKEALTELRAGSFDVVLTDMKMETENAGYEVVRFARNAQPRGMVAVLTAYPSRCCDWQEQGAHALLEKPMSPQALLSHIETLIAQIKLRLYARPVSRAA